MDKALPGLLHWVTHSLLGRKLLPSYVPILQLGKVKLKEGARVFDLSKSPALPIG